MEMALWIFLYTSGTPAPMVGVFTAADVVVVVVVLLPVVFVSFLQAAMATNNSKTLLNRIRGLVLMVLFVYIPIRSWPTDFPSEEMKIYFQCNFISLSINGKELTT